MNLLVKSIFLCLATSIAAITPLRSAEKTSKKIPASVLLNVDEQGNILSFKVLKQANGFNLLQHEISVQGSHAPLQEPFTDKDRALMALKNTALDLAYGIYEFTVLVFITGKLIFVHAGEAALKILKKIDLYVQRRKNQQPIMMPLTAQGQLS